MNKERVKALTNLVVMLVLLVNAGLTAAGMNPIPFDESALTEVISYIAAGIASVWAWWKNNNVTKAAQEGQEVTNILKHKFVDDGEENTEVEA